MSIKECPEMAAMRLVAPIPQASNVFVLRDTLMGRLEMLNSLQNSSTFCVFASFQFRIDTYVAGVP